MSKVDKLKILGVRSFDNIRSETIQFHTPLTLIVGDNGSGKTTIIECLKFATTGQLPPNSTKGGAFIHDPKLCGEKEVLAQVKLQFKGTSGARLVVTRSLQLTVKKATRSQKTLDGSLLMMKDGERTTISQRVAELNQVVPQYLGVSEAVLDTVIFCHQEESLWPMSEPSVLKKKFDEIFEAMRYTKAIDNLKNLRKAQGIELDKFKVSEGQYKSDKDKGERLQKRSHALQEEIEALRDQSERLSHEMTAAGKASKEKHTEANQALGFINELNNKQDRANWLQESINTLRTTLEELHEPDEWLESTLEQYDERIADYERQSSGHQAQYQKLKQDTADNRNRISEKQAERGQYQAEKENYERQVQTQRELVKEAAGAHEIRGYDGELSRDQIDDFIDRVRKLSRDKDRELERLRKATDDELLKTQSLLTDLEGRRTAGVQEKVTAKQTISSNERKLNVLQREVGFINIDEAVKMALEISHKELQDQFQKSTNTFEAAGWDEKLRAENNNLRELESESERLRNELIQSNRLAKDRAELEFITKEVKDRQRSLDTMKSTYGENLTSIIGSEWQVDSLDREYQAVAEQKARAVADAKKQQSHADRQRGELQFKLNQISTSLKTKKAELAKCQSTVLNSIIIEGQPLSSVDQYLEELDIMEKEADTIKSDINNFTNMKEYYDGCMRTIEKEDKCKLCERKFTEPKSRSIALEKIRQRQKDETRVQLIADLESLNAELQPAIAARSSYDTYSKLSATEVPDLERGVRELKLELENLVRTLEKHDMLVSEETKAKEDVDALGKTITTIVQYGNEIARHETDIARISSQQKLSGGSLTIEEIEERHTVCDEQIRTLKSRISKISSDKDHAKTLINRSEVDLEKASSNLRNARSEIEKRRNLSSQIGDLRESSTHQREVIQRTDDKLESLVPQTQKAKAQHEEAQQRGRTQEKGIRADKDRLADTVNKFKLVAEAILAYQQKGGDARLTACQRAIDSLEGSLQQIERDVADVTRHANEVKKRIADGERMRRNITDNISFRKSLRDLEAVKSEIRELDARNATADFERLRQEAERHDLMYQKLLAERGPILGSMKSKDEELARYLVEWDTDFKMAAQRFRESHIRVETTKAAVDDLAKYSKALEAAIMKYHTMKMEEINRIAGELWQSTYQGTDVDTIMIRSENEVATSKRSYNYRLVMVKQDAEMDMRGRCSAGQKVLASIIIRLALAECFGVNCGLIALDEPTTNLDRDNIKALAESLHRIIKTRQAQSNFQLIVITHDEEFLREMKCNDFCDSYYRVSRDEKQKSVIEMQSIAEVI